MICLCLFLSFVLENVNSFDNFKLNTSKLYYIDSHLNIDHIKRLCENRGRVCNSSDNIVCAVRWINKTFEYKDFNNSCYLFMANMCDLPGHEFSIANSGRCASNQTRRLILQRNQSNTNFKNINVTARPILRTKPTSKEPSTLYDIDTAFDYHPCPLSCPDVYSPVCVGVNRGFGLYYKFYTFINHCAGDRYYCKNWREFSPPPDEDEMVRSSPLSWSFCAANRYIQFARFAELTSSMGHYGWLAGDYRPTHIMRPWERDPRNG